MLIEGYTTVHIYTEEKPQEAAGLTWEGRA